MSRACSSIYWLPRDYWVFFHDQLLRHLRRSATLWTLMETFLSDFVYLELIFFQRWSLIEGLFHITSSKRQNQIHLKVCAALIVFTMYYKDGAKQFFYRNSALWSGFWFHYLSRWYDKFKLKIASLIFDRKETSDCKKSKPSCLFFWRPSS